MATLWQGNGGKSFDVHGSMGDLDECVLRGVDRCNPVSFRFQAQGEHLAGIRLVINDRDGKSGIIGLTRQLHTPQKGNPRVAAPFPLSMPSMGRSLCWTPRLRTR